jgi:hypothetical protein
LALSKIVKNHAKSRIDSAEEFNKYSTKSAPKVFVLFTVGLVPGATRCLWRSTVVEVPKIGCSRPYNRAAKCPEQRIKWTAKPELRDPTRKVKEAAGGFVGNVSDSQSENRANDG